ncbi:MAG: hypothetical protein HRT47_03305 [Candidatus Caenarcaniphilales bacterium]|nr:hypothetical protein [Candidatus Caenarcaniphilales bacterium]
MRLFFLALFLLLATYISSFQEGLHAADSTLIAEEDSEFEVDPQSQPIYYELVQERFKPEDGEYYLDGVFSSRGEAFVRISRAKGPRANELHKYAATYRSGDYIDEGLFVSEINIRKRSVIVFDEFEKRYYQLKMSYGNAVSRLTPIAKSNSSE